MDNQQTRQIASALGLDETAYVENTLQIEMPCTKEQVQGFQLRLAALFGNALLFEANSMFASINKKGDVISKTEKQVWVLQSSVRLSDLKRHAKMVRYWIDAIKLVCGVEAILMRIDEVTFSL